MTLRPLFAAALLLVACPGPTGPQPNATYFWQLTSSALEFGACADDADFRSGIAPIEVNENTFLIYKVSADGRQAVSQTCTALSPSACTPRDGGVVFDVAGTELTFSESLSSPIGTTGCQLQQTQSWTAIDNVRSIDITINDVLTLSGNDAGCATVEADLKRRSPNGLGVEGCVIVNTLKGTLK